jgi:hypothetical protein
MEVSDPNHPTVLATAANTFEAAMIVGSLDARGISAKAVGDYTAAFQVGVASEVQILVRQADLASAQQALSEVRDHDWDDEEHSSASYTD